MKKDDQGNDDARLEAVRREIAAIDAEIVSLVARRIGCAVEIARMKKSRGLPPRDIHVENEVAARMERACRSLGLDPALGRELARVIIARSVEAQKRSVDGQEGAVGS